MLDKAQIASIGDDLLDAHENRTVLPRLTARFPHMTLEDSYSIQEAWSKRRIQAGARVVGHKIGLTSKVMQAATGIAEPDYGVIHDDAVFESGTRLNYQHFSNVRVETELAFVLSRSLRGPMVSLTDVLKAIDYVVPALEILDSRLELEGRTIIDTISDNAALGAVVLGGCPMRADKIDLPWVSAMLYRNETIEDSGVAGSVLGHPAQGVSWLANKLHAHGQELKAGEVILSGSFTRPMWVGEGDTIFADFNQLGVVACHFD